MTAKIAQLSAHDDAPKAVERQSGKLSRTERVLLAIAQAYGIGQVLTPRYVYATERDADTGAELHATVGLSVARWTETLSKAGQAVSRRGGKATDPEARGWWAALNADGRASVEAWDDGRFKHRGRRVAYRVGEFIHWKMQTAVVMVPTCRPTHAVLHSLAQAKLPRVLEDWLLCVAIQDASRWPLVARALESVGHPAWAVEEAGFLMVYGSTQTQGERAMCRGIRKEAYADTVRAARTVLDRWLWKAARAIWIPHESDRQMNHGDPTGIRPET